MVSGGQKCHSAASHEVAHYSTDRSNARWRAQAQLAAVRKSGGQERRGDSGENVRGGVNAPHGAHEAAKLRAVEDRRHALQLCAEQGTRHDEEGLSREQAIVRATWQGRAGTSHAACREGPVRGRARAISARRRSEHAHRERAGRKSARKWNKEAPRTVCCSCGERRWLRTSATERCATHRTRRTRGEFQARLRGAEA